MAKKGKTKLPKRIAGFKIPKALRKNSGLLMELLQTPQLQAAVASGLAAAAAALGDGKATRTGAAKASRRLKFAAEEGMDQIATLADTVGGAVTASLERWFSHREDEKPAADAAGKEKPSPGRGSANTH